MVHHSRLTLILVISAIVTAGLILLIVTRTSTWAQDSGVHEEKANHSHGTGDDAHVHGEREGHTHGTGDDGHVHGEDSSHPHAEEDTVRLSDKAKANIGLKTAETDVRTIEQGVQVTGNVIPHPSGRIDVTPRVGGIVRNIHFSLGDSPDKGRCAT